MNGRPADAKEKAVETLEIEGEDARQDRLQNILQKLNTSSGCQQPKENKTVLDIGKRDAPIPEVTNQLLARVQAFLPQIEASNAILAQADPTSLDIENVAETDNRYIEMNLGLGVFEDRNKPLHNDSVSSSSSEDEDPSSSASSSDSSDSVDDEDDDDCSFDNMPSVASRPIKPLPKRMQPQHKILELSDHPSTS